MYYLGITNLNGIRGGQEKMAEAYIAYDEAIFSQSNKVDRQICDSYQAKWAKARLA